MDTVKYRKKIINRIRKHKQALIEPSRPVDTSQLFLYHDDIQYEGLHTEPKPASHGRSRSRKALHATVGYIGQMPKKQKVGMSVLLLVAIGVSGGLLVTGNKKDPTRINQVAGVSTTANDQQSNAAPQIDTDVKPDFSLLMPSGKTQKDVSFARVSPRESAPVYAYIDTFIGENINVSQQEVPETFTSAPEAMLEKTAKDFQATNIIQVDSVTVYHGFSEKLRTQSLVFIKKNRLIFIKSPKKITDEQWAGYIAGLH